MYVDKVATLATPSPIFSGGVQTSPLNVPQNNLQNAATTASQGLSMKNWIWAVAFLIIGAAALGQTSNTLYARNFPGITVGQKIAAAQADCSANTAVPCVIVIDPSLASFATGTMPAKCPQCVWEDLRAGASFGAPRGVWGQTVNTYGASPFSGVASAIYAGYSSPPPNSATSITTLANYGSLGSTAQYVENDSAPPLLTLTATTFTATSVTSSGLEGSMIPVGVVVEAAAGCAPSYPTEPCIAYAGTLSGSTLNLITDWTVIGNGTVTVTPPSGTSVAINPTNAIFGQNIVMNLKAGSGADSEVGQEIDLQSTVSGAQSETGSQVVNDGVPTMARAYYANGNASHFTDGFLSNSNLNDFSAEGFTQYGFRANPSGAGYPFAYVNFGTGSQLWFVDSGGNIFAEGMYGYKGAQLSTPSAPTYSISTTGGSLGAGTLNFCLAAEDAAGDYTPCSSSVAVTLTGSTNEITFTWSPIPAAIGYMLYLVNNGSHSFAAGTTYTLKSVGPTGWSPPATNQTGGISSPGPVSGSAIEENGVPLASTNLSDSASLMRNVATYHHTGLTANVGNAIAFTAPSGVHLYHVICVTYVTTAATTSSTVPACQIYYNNGAGTAVLFTPPDSNGLSQTANTVGSSFTSSGYIEPEPGTAIDVSTAQYASAGTTSMAYTADLAITQVN